MRVAPAVVIVTRPTRLQGLRERWGTLGQAKFLLRAARAIESADESDQIATMAPTAAITKGKTTEQADFDEYEAEDSVYQAAIDRLETELQSQYPTRVIPRSFVPSFDFGMTMVVLVVGQDGLVANVAKYVGDVPIIAINPDPQRIDGVLLPFEIAGASSMVDRVASDRFDYREVTLAEATLNDGQRMLAFNDFFVGAASHVSARYILSVGDRSEPQSSSGLLVCTGAGSTGWISSAFNMAAGIAKTVEGSLEVPGPMNWDARHLRWVVREPFLSRTSQIGLVAGTLPASDQLKVESLMPDGGVIFSDGIEADFLPFNSGLIAHIGISQQTAKLAIPS